MIDDFHIMQVKVGHVILQGNAVCLTVFYGDDGTLRSHESRLDGDTLPADDTDVILGGNHHFIQDDGTDFTAYIVDGATLEHLIAQTDFGCVAGIGV